MPTNKIALRSIDQFMADYVPTYNPIYSLFLGKSRQYQDDVGQLSFRRVEAVGDIRPRQITPKDTEIRQISVQEGSKYFKKYYLANQYVLSHLQNPEGTEQAVAQVLDEHQKLFDEMFFSGEGTSNNDVVNNGMFWSGDANYTVNGSVEIDLTDRLADFHSDVMATAVQADALAGRKIIMFYGSNIVPLYNSVYASAAVSFKRLLEDVLGPNYSTMALPSQVTPASNHGWMIVNLDQIMVHYTKLPGIDNQGSNDEKKYDWFNFIQGSSMVEVLASGGIIRQPATLE